MRTKLYILRHTSGKVGFLVMKLNDNDIKLEETVEKIRRNESGWVLRESFVLDTDIYERLPQYTLILAEKLAR